MPTLSSGSSVTLTLGAFESLSMISGVAGQSSIAFTSLAPNVHPDVTVTKAQSKTYGPFGVPMTVVISCSDGSVTYTQNRGAAEAVWSDSAGAALVDPQGYVVPAGPQWSGLTYNGAGAPIAGAIGGASFTFGYDAQGRLQTIEQSGRTLSVSYDGNGHVSGVA